MNKKIWKLKKKNKKILSALNLLSILFLPKMKKANSRFRLFFGKKKFGLILIKFWILSA